MSNKLTTWDEVVADLGLKSASLLSSAIFDTISEKEDFKSFAADATELEYMTVTQPYELINNLYAAVRVSVNRHCLPVKFEIYTCSSEREAVDHYLDFMLEDRERGAKYVIKNN